MDYETGIRLDALNEKLDLILVKLYPKETKNKKGG